MTILTDETLVNAAHLLSRMGERPWFTGMREQGYHVGKLFYNLMEQKLVEGAITPFNDAGQPLKSDFNLTVYYHGDTTAQQKVSYPFGVLKSTFAEAVERLSLDPAYVGEFDAAARDILEPESVSEPVPQRIPALAL